MKRSKWNGFATIYKYVEFLFGAGRLRERLVPRIGFPGLTV